MKGICFSKSKEILYASKTEQKKFVKAYKKIHVAATAKNTINLFFISFIKGQPPLKKELKGSLQYYPNLMTKIIKPA